MGRLSLAESQNSVYFPILSFLPYFSHIAVVVSVKLETLIGVSQPYFLTGSPDDRSPALCHHLSVITSLSSPGVDPVIHAVSKT